VVYIKYYSGIKEKKILPFEAYFQKLCGNTN